MPLTKQFILVVEDDENDIFFMKRAFKAAGLDNPFYVVSDGQSAINYLLGKDQFADRTKYPLPELVLLDLKLPRKSGLEVLATIREEQTLESLVIIMFSSSNELVDITTAYHLGVNSYALKPSKSEDLLEFVKAVKAYWIQFNQFKPLFFGSPKPA